MALGYIPVIMSVVSAVTRVISHDVQDRHPIHNGNSPGHCGPHYNKLLGSPQKSPFPCVLRPRHALGVRKSWLLDSQGLAAEPIPGGCPLQVALGVTSNRPQQIQQPQRAIENDPFSRKNGFAHNSQFNCLVTGFVPSFPDSKWMWCDPPLKLWIWRVEYQWSS